MNCNCNKEVVIDAGEYVCTGCGDTYGMILETQYRKFNYHAPVIKKHDRCLYLKKTFSPLIYPPEKEYLNSLFVEEISQILKLNEDVTWYELLTVVKKLKNPDVKMKWYLPAAIGFQWSFDRKWLEKIEWLKAKRDRLPKLNNLYCLWQILKHENKNTDWIPITFKPTSMVNMNKCWAPVCSKIGWKYVEMTPKPINYKELDCRNIFDKNGDVVNEMELFDISVDEEISD